MMEVLHPHCAGLDVHKDSVVACVRHMVDGDVKREVRSFKTTTKGLLALLEWLSVEGCTHIVMEATGVYWKPVWNILSDGDFGLVLANAAHIKNVPGRKTDVSDAAWIADLLAHGLMRSSFVPEQMLWGRRRDNAVKSSLRSTPIDGAPLCRSPTTRAKHASPPLFRIAHLPW